MSNRNGAKKGNNYAAVIMVFILIVVIALVIAVLLPNVNRRSGRDSSPTVMLSSNILKSSISSGTDGSSHTVEAKFTIEYDREAAPDVKKDELFNNIQNTLRSLDYDQLADYGGLDYMKEEIMSHLNASNKKDFDLSAIEGIYVTDLISDGVLPVEVRSHEKADEAFKGLFKSAK